MSQCRSFSYTESVSLCLVFVEFFRVDWRPMGLNSGLWQNRSIVSGKISIDLRFSDRQPSSSIIHDISCHCLEDPSLAFAYFYFDFNDAKKRVVKSLISSLVTQFCRRCAFIPEGLATLYSNSLDGRHQPTITSPTKILRNILTAFRHAYIVLDALDECTEQDDLLSFIEEITDWKLDGLHILATSRQDQMTNERLASRISDSVDLQSAIVDLDIRVHIRERLRSDFSLKKWPPKVKEEIEKSLMEGANGM